MVESVYVETTIVSYLVARPSADPLLRAHQELTRRWWTERKPSFRCIASSRVAMEAGAGDPRMAAARMEAIAELEMVDSDDEIEAMSLVFLETGAIPPTQPADALHLAAAAGSGADFLLTWNCKHLANAHVLRRLEKEAARRGWNLPTVCTPLEMMD